MHHLCSSHAITVIRVQLGINCPVPSGRTSQTERRRDHRRGGDGERKKKRCSRVDIRVLLVRECVHIPCVRDAYVRASSMPMRVDATRACTRA